MSLSGSDIKQMSKFKFDITGRTKGADMGQAKTESDGVMERSGEE